MLIILLLISAIISESACDDNPDLLITTAEGLLQGGSMENDLTKEPLYGFLNIPYAQPPIEDKRFKEPQDPLPWEGVLNAKSNAKTCMKYNPIFQMISGKEDCLYLHVYTSQLPKEVVEPKPVMVWIHGGAFHSGSGSLDNYGPDFLLSQDVVVVCINYRLNVFGFLSLDTKEFSGNYGLKDQIMALKWVQRNIKAFGGNPDSVTIFGESAGGASVHYLVLAPSARGLFHKAIAQSGCALNPWATTTQTRVAALDLGEVFECDTKDDELLIKCLREVEAEELVTRQYNAISPFEDDKGLRVFLPSIEPPDSKEPIFTKPALELAREGKLADVPFITGTVESETSFLSKIYSSQVPGKARTKLLKKLNKDPTWMIPDYMEIKDTDKKNRIAQKIKEFYFGKSYLNNATILNLINLTTDTSFLLGTHDSVYYQSRSAKSPVFEYHFLLDDEYGNMKSMLSITAPGPTHSDELGYLFLHNSSPQELEEDKTAYKAMLTMVKLWTNFAKFGNPTPDNELGEIWKPYTNDKRYYLEISEKLILKEDVEKDRMEFWKKLDKEEGL